MQLQSCCAAGHSSAAAQTILRSKGSTDRPTALCALVPVRQAFGGSPAAAAAKVGPGLVTSGAAAAPAPLRSAVHKREPGFRAGAPRSMAKKTRRGSPGAAPACLPACLPACPPACLPARLPACPPACLPPIRLQSLCLHIYWLANCHARPKSGCLVHGGAHACPMSAALKHAGCLGACRCLAELCIPPAEAVAPAPAPPAAPAKEGAEGEAAPASAAPPRQTYAASTGYVDNESREEKLARCGPNLYLRWTGLPMLRFCVLSS